MEQNINRFLLEQMFLKVLRVEHIESSSIDWSSHVQSNAWIIVAEGDICLTIANQPYTIAGFQIIHLTKRGPLSMRATTKVSIYVIDYIGEILYRDELLLALQQQASLGQPIFFYTLINPFVVIEMANNLYCHYQKKQMLAVQADFHQLMAQVFAELEQQKHSELEQALAYIERHLYQPISIQDVAQHTQLSTQKLFMLFQAHFGHGPKQYIQQQQRQLAQKYLQQSHYQIKDIAQAMHFNTEIYFSRAFKKWTGLTPSEYLEKSIINKSEKPINNENHFQYNNSQLMQAKLFENGSNTIMLKKLATPFLVSLILLLAACGADSTQKMEDAPKEEATTRVIIDDAGREVEIPIKPERIVTDWYLGQVLALDIVPVGAVVANLDYAAFLKQYYKEGDITNIGTDGSVSLEKVLELKPDLIITWNVDDVEKFEKIAPTIVFSESAHQGASDEIKAMGDYLDRQAEADAFVKDFEKRIDAARQKIYAAIPEDATFTIFDVFEKNATVVANDSVSGGRALYQVLGMKPQEKVQELFDTKESNNGRYDVSYEVVGDYVGDYVFVINFFNKDENFPATWTNLDVVKNNKTLHLAPEYYFASDPLSVLHQAEEMAETIVEAAKSAQ
ncbi:AraC family transcriptional regulator [Metasolibacillus meyeri]|uniref:AraC family transcriptional regulator n=1 Tax=Metasolibacillus meyeri TaxID=1071052 RepID=UPI000D3082D9|nr:AraC family transcriptional regulator [Metasolibacillus meyeri]